MKTNKSANSDQKKQTDQKLTYERPAIIHSETIEALAGVCNTAAGGKLSGGCTVARS